MEVGPVTKIDDLQTSYSDSLDSGDYLTLGSIKLSEAKESVTFAFHRPGEQILLKTDLTSMKNYVAQKQIEDYVYLTPDSARMPGANFENVPIYEEGSSSGFVKKAASTVADFLPYIGTGKTFAELISGYDPITGEEVSRIVSAFGLVGSVIPVPGLGKAGKFVGKAFVYGAEYIAKNPEVFGKKILERNVNKISNESPDFLKKFWPEKTKDASGLISEKRRKHILDGDETGGGYRYGTGIKGKTEIPKQWTDDKIINVISDIATDPKSVVKVGRGGRRIMIGERDGIKVKVILDNPQKGGEILTAFPID